MSTAEAFTVSTPLMTVAVETRGTSVTQIRLNQAGLRPPTTPFEQRVAGELDEYAQGGRMEFTFATAPQGTQFDHRVWREVARIPYGSTATYGEIARRIGSPGAARAVGHANGRNPIPLVIPCHRVVAAGGKLGGYGGGLPLKRRLLAREQRGSVQSS
jgi:methylated-DNA-[protein]-cysteine S-methyltransferase